MNDTLRNVPDPILAARYVDGELAPEQRHQLEQRMLREPALADEVRQVQELRDLFAAERGRPAGPALRDGFAGRVLQRTARAPQPAATADRDLRFVRRCTWLAAAALIVAALLASGVLGRPSSGLLQADTDLLIEMLDQQVRAAGATEAPR